MNLRNKDPEKYIELAYESMNLHVELMLAVDEQGRHYF